VCAAVARVLVVPVAAVRITFIVLTFFHLLGLILYVGLWLVIPARPGEESLLERLLQWALGSVRSFRGGNGRPPENGTHRSSVEEPS
jgi:phage shock protein PspC (stress-responsive transcriptional regulator)